jgi:hypothetical protein
MLNLTCRGFLPHPRISQPTLHPHPHLLVVFQYVRHERARLSLNGLDAVINKGLNRCATAYLRVAQADAKL